MLNRRKFAASAGLGLLASPMLMARHAKAAEFNFKYGGTVSAEHPLMKNVASAAERIRVATEGRVDVQVFPSGQLGSEADMLAQVRSGALEFMTNSGLLLSSLVPSASLPGVAYTFEDYPAVWRALDGDLGAFVRRNIERTNLVVFERIFDAGFFNVLTGNREIAGPSDLEGLKLRVPPSPMWITLYKALKAAPAAIGWGEVYTALQTKVVDGVDASLGGFSDAKLYEVQKHLILTNHIWDGWWMLGNKRAFERLPPDLREIVRAEFNRAADNQRLDAAKLADDTITNFANRGVKIARPNRAAFQDALRKTSYYSEWKAKFGEEAWALLEKSAGRPL